MAQVPGPTSHEVVVPLPPAQAFRLFTHRLASWWPREYTWSGKALETIGIEPCEGGRCTEHGPLGFQCDWGRVLLWAPPQRLVLAWQIGPHREPQPDPEMASTVDVSFDGVEPASTRVLLTHRDFERHGSGADEYRQALASGPGWPLILDRFAQAADH